MAKLVVDGAEIEVADNEHFVEAAESLGVAFGCTEGICGTCKAAIVEGGENLTPLNQEEIDFGLLEGERLLCQCKIKSGCCKFKYM